MQIVPTQLEIEAFTTDLNVKKEIKEKKKAAADLFSSSEENEET
jgi:hypothetical protein